MEARSLRVYTFVDGVNDIPFPNADTQLILGEYTYTDYRMGIPVLSATVYYPTCLDDVWTKKEYVTINGEKQWIVNIPTSSKSTDDIRYKHEIAFKSGRDILNHIYFEDVVTNGVNVDRYVSNSTDVTFYGDLEELVQRLNYSLARRNVGYSVVIDEGITTEPKEVSFSDTYILKALQSAYESIFEIPFYFAGTVIHFGFANAAITYPFKYGYEDALLSITKSNANYKVINLITGVGSSENIPYYYPNVSADRAAIEAAGGTWIEPVAELRPSIFRNTSGAESYYKALNNTYINPDTGLYYNFNNPYTDQTISQHKQDFSDIKPTIVGMTNQAGQLMAVFDDFAYDSDDNDEVDSDGNYTHPYFYAKLRLFNGTYGFNLFDSGIVGSDMTINFTSGNLGACKCTIGVSYNKETGVYSNPVQVDNSGNIVAGTYADKVKENNIQPRQQDTSQYAVWIALKKDNSTFGVVMPNAANNYKPTIGDEFNITNINLPQSYILFAEDKLTKSIIKYMAMNNDEKFNFSCALSSVFVGENDSVAQQINPNASILIEYNNKQVTQYINTYTYKETPDSILPTIEIEVSETISVNKGQLESTIYAVKEDIMTSVGNVDFYKNGLKYFLRKDTEDFAKKLITFLSGLKSLGNLDIGNFVSGMLTGKGGRIDAQGNAEFQSAVIRGSMKVMELLINRLYAIESDYVYTEADTVEEVEEVGDKTYRLTLRRKYDGYFTAQKENNVLFGVINSLANGSGGEFYTAWSRVLSVNTTDNTITVVMYPDNEVPDGVNYPPAKGMVLARKGSSDSPLDGSHNERQDFWSMSSSDGRLLFLQNVAKPILEEYYYTLSVGKLPELEKFKALPIGKDDTAVYAKNIVAENYYQIDASGNVQTQEVYRGAWSADVAASDQPYRRIVNDVATPTGSTSHVLAVHTVYHRGCKWACLTDMTTLEPKWNSSAWQFLEGDSNYSIRFSAYPSERVRINAVNMVVTARVYYGNLDVTDELLALPGTDIQWTRNSGIIPEDNAWHPALGATKNILNITNQDMATNWLAVQRVGFVITVFIPTGDGTYYQATDELPITI